jgi:hypothetical protein
MNMRNKFISAVFILMVNVLACPEKGACTEIIMSPEMTIKIYFDAYVAQDWEVVTAYMHPALLYNLKRRIMDMVNQVSPETRRVLLRGYHARSVGELEQMPARQLYILYLKDRWEGMDAQTEMGIGKAELFFMKTKKVNPEECIVEFKSAVTLDNQSLNKVQTYHLKKYEGKWKIYNTDGLKNLDKDVAADQKPL